MCFPFISALREWCKVHLFAEGLGSSEILAFSGIKIIVPKIRSIVLGSGVSDN